MTSDSILSKYNKPILRRVSAMGLQLVAMSLYIGEVCVCVCVTVTTVLERVVKSLSDSEYKCTSISGMVILLCFNEAYNCNV